MNKTRTTYYSITIHRDGDSYKLLPMSAERLNRWIERQTKDVNFSVQTSISDTPPVTFKSKVKRVGISRTATRKRFTQQQLHEREATQLESD